MKISNFLILFITNAKELISWILVFDRCLINKKLFKSNIGVFNIFPKNKKSQLEYYSTGFPALKDRNN
jgi:hypothetical protein